MADYEFSNKNYTEALSLYKKALEIIRACYGEKSEAFLSVSKNIDFVEDLRLLELVMVKKVRHSYPYLKI